MAPTIDIARRLPNQLRAGQLTLTIDGVDAEYTNDPAQHFAACLAANLEAGLSQAEATEKAEADAQACARHALDRVADRIRRGRFFPGGMPTDVGGLAPELLPLVKHTSAGRLAGSPADAAAAFMNRGRLAGLDPKQRLARVARRENNHAAEWKKNRERLLADRNVALQRLQSEVVSCPPDRRPKLLRAIAQLEAEISGLQIGIVAASHAINYALGQYMQAGVNFVSDTIKFVPCMTNTTVDTERDAKDQVSDFTTLDEADGSGYSTGGVTLANKAVNVDDANDRAECDCDDATISSFGACTRPLQGLLLIKWITNLTSSLPLHWLEFSSNKTPDGSDFVLQINAEGYLQAS